MDRSLNGVHPDAVEKVQLEFHVRRPEKNHRRPVDQIRRQNVIDHRKRRRRRRRLFKRRQSDVPVFLFLLFPPGKS